MTIPDEAVQAAINAWFEETREHVKSVEPLPEQARRMRLALTAALPFLTGVKVDSAKIETIGHYEARYCEDIPTDCCDYGVVDLSAGIEVCRVWKEEDARRIAELLNGGSAPSPRAQALEEAALMLEAKADAANSRAVAFTEKLSGPLKGRKKSERWRSEKNHNERIKFYYQKAAAAIRALPASPVASSTRPTGGSDHGE